MFCSNFCLPLPTWTRKTLSLAGDFVKAKDGWDFLFSSIVWNLWLYRNAMVFDPDNVSSEPVLDFSRRQADEALRAYQTLLVAHKY
ncbi:hypothetical protein V6N13_127356 [Hibiscus sabdariffa]